MKRILSFGCLLLISCAHAQDIPEEAIHASKNIEPDAIRSHMRFLADDILEGRKPFSKGYQLAAKYVASQFEQMGLKPGAGDTSYFQTVQLTKVKTITEGNLSINRKNETKYLAYGKDFLLVSEPRDLDLTEKEIVFAGAAVQDASLGRQDIEKLDVNDKFVILYLSQSEEKSPLFMLKQKDSPPNRRIHKLKEDGATGVIIFLSLKDQEKLPWEMLKYYYSRMNYRMGDLDFPVFLINRQQIDTIFDSSSHALEDYMSGKVLPHQFKFKSTIKLDIQKKPEFETRKSPNVLGYLEGSDSELKHEYIIYTAHLDHVGIGRPIAGDSIYNGAYDNASGTAIMIEIARAYTKLISQPKRSVLFIALTAEEMGLLGSEYYVDYPTVPLENIVATLNTDMFLMEKPLTEIVVLGGEYSELGTLANLACQFTSVSMVPDPAPEENLFFRSDHFNFVKKGIPSLFLVNPYYKSDTIDDNTDANYRWLKTIYHTPQDNFRNDIHYDSGVTYGQINFLIGYLAAQQEERIKWNFDLDEDNPLRITR